MADKSYLESIIEKGVYDTLSPLVNLVPGANWEKSLEQKDFEAENPVLSLGTDIAEFAIPFGAYLKGAKAVGYTDKIAKLATAEKIAQAPFKTRALQEAALFAPFELGHQALELADAKANPEVYGEKTLGEAISTAALDTGMAGLIGGTLGKIASAGKKLKVPKVLQGLQASDPLQFQLRKVKTRLADLGNSLDAEAGEEAGILQGAYNQIESKILREGTRGPVRELETEAPKLGRLNSIWRQGADKGTRKLVVDLNEGFRTLTAKENALEELGLPTGWSSEVQFPRIISSKTPRRAGQVDKTIQETLNPVGNDWWLGREKEGMYILAKKKSGSGNWFIAKTDNPGYFMPEQAGLLKQTARDKAFHAPEQIISYTGDASSPLDKALQFRDAFAEGGAMPSKAGKESLAGWAERMASGKAGKAIQDNLLVDSFSQELKHKVFPTVFEFASSPRARKIYAGYQYTRNKILRDIADRLHGKIKIDGQSVWQLAGGGLKNKGIRREAEDSVRKAWVDAFGTKGAPKKAWEVMKYILDNRIPTSLEQAALKAGKQDVLHSDLWGLLGEKGQKALQMLDDLDKGEIEKWGKVATNLGLPDKYMYPVLNGHRGFSHYWEGDIRREILGENGQRIAIVSGTNKKGVDKLAEKAIEKARAEGRNWSAGEWWKKDRDVDLAAIKSLQKEGNSDFVLAEELIARARKETGANASFLKGSAEIGGWGKGQDPDAYFQNLQYSMENKGIYFGNLINQKIYARELSQLALDDPRTAEALVDKLNVLEGKMGPIGQIVNAATDKILAPVLGKDSASKIVRTLNAGSMYLDLGFSNLAYVTANLLQPITTVLPQLSMMKNCPEALQWAYDSIPLIGKGTVGVGNTINPLKLMKEGLGLMAHPEKRPGFREFLEQAVSEGALSPRFIEQYVGEASEVGQGILESFKQGEFSQALKGIATAAPSFSEQASRGYALSVGYALFDSLAQATGQLSKEQVYRGAIKFMENTMFQFAASDRAMLLQGPIGNAWGLFKNWTMHYVGWQLEYLGAGLKHNCWAPYLWSNAATSVLGGLSASELGSMATSFVEWYSGKKAEETLYENCGPGISAGLLYGLPGAFGYSLKGQVNSPFTDIGEELNRFMGFVWGNRLGAIWRASGDGINYFLGTGNSPMHNEQFRRELYRALAPKMIYRSMQVMNGAVYDSKGNLVLRDLSPTQAFAYRALNLTPIRVEQGFKISNEIWNNKEKRAQATARYAELFLEATLEGNSNQAETLVRKMIADGVDVQSVMQSMQTRLKNRYLTPLERNQAFFPELAGIDWDNLE